ncbi:MAG TPA: glucosaminidase domain-containing protein [Ferruginibacter sp.]|nr:glucosaminidase domain-containing protein [Ferruginibacter sp.]
MIKIILAGLFLSASFGAGAQRISPEQYIEQYKDFAIREMKRMGVPAAITLAQGILETESGNSDLVRRSNNHFGIKCKESWTGGRVFHNDDAEGECFRSYGNAEDSYRDHSNYLRGSKRYESLFRLEATDYEGWAYGLKRAGYATNPRYPDILIKNIKQYNLQQYSLAGVGEVPQFEAGKYQDDKAKLMPVQAEEEKADTPETSLATDVPDNVISINKAKCVFAKKGTSLLVIAARNNINLNKVLSFNELAEDGILANDQYVYLEKKSRTGDKDLYIAQEGETVYDVAQKNGIQLEYLAAYNDLKGNETLNAGTRLSLRPGYKVNNNAQAKGRTHTVAPKEGLYAIAKKYNVTVSQLKEWNSLDTNDLRIGQEIIVSK